MERLRLLVTTAGLLMGFLCGAALGEEPPRSEIRVGSELEFPPYAFVDNKGEPAGFSVDLIRAVAANMGLSVKISTGAWNTVWNDLAAGRLDVLPVVAKLPERRRVVDFSLPHTETYDAFFVREGAPLLSSLDSAVGREIVVMRSDAAHQELESRSFKGDLVLVDTIPEGLSLIASGRHDAFLCSKIIGMLEIKEHGIKGLVAGPAIADYKRVFSFAVKKGDAVLLEKLNQGLLIVKTSGEYDRIYERWLSVDDPWRRYRRYVAPALVTLLIAVVVSGGGIVLLERLVRKRTHQLAETNRTLEQERAELEEKVARRTEELSRSNAELHAQVADRVQAEEELKALHEDLERRIRQRTEELASANRALQRENGERRKAEEAQRVLAEAFRDLYNNAPCGYHSLNADGVFVQINDTELKWLGYEQHEVIGKVRFSDLITPEGKETFNDDFPSFKARGEVRDLEYKMLRKDGTVLPVLLSETAVRDDSGGFLMSRATMFDMTERKKIEAEVLRAAKLATLGELAASVAHEINNPINSIINYAQVLEDRGCRNGNEQALTGEIIREGMRIASIVRDLLSYAKDTKDVKTPLAVGEVISSSLALTNSLMRRERIRVTVQVPGGLPRVTGNAQQLQQVFLNIVNNARDALKEKYPDHHEGKVLEIRAENATAECGEVVRISFCDHGTGIPASILGKVKEPFFTTKPGSLGTGLGLSISNAIITAHNGSLGIDSREGEYTRVTVELPAAARSGGGGNS